MDTNAATQPKKKIRALLDVDESTLDLIKSCRFADIELMRFATGIDLAGFLEKNKNDVQAIVSQSEVIAPNGLYLHETLGKRKLPDIPFVLLSNNLNDNLATKCMESGIADVFKFPVKKETLLIRLPFLMDHWSQIRSKKGVEEIEPYKVPFMKRAFDVVSSGIALVCLAPVFLIIMIIMKLESNGPVFYYSKRVGTGYRIFKFYKFRSMYMNADKKLKDLKHLNQYDNADAEISQKTDTNLLCDECVKNGTKCMYVMYADDNSW